jgi:CheY-like chemotaxis protein
MRPAVLRNLATGMDVAATADTPMHAHDPTEILLVAEDGESTDELATALERHCLTVHPLCGLRAIEWMRHQAMLPAMILIDWTMPRGDAARFLAQQASDPRYASVPVVVTDLAHMRSVPTLCVSATVAKPVRVRTLVDVISRLCRPAYPCGPAELAHGSSTSNLVIQREAYPLHALSSRSQELTRPLPGSDDETARNRCSDDRTAPTPQPDRRA